MTREEAMEYAEKKNLKLEEEIERPGSYYGAYAMYSTELEFVSMAISALRQQDHFREVTKKVEPLTLDELRRMEGQPVYIVENTEYWAIVNSFDQAGVYLLSYGNPDDYGYFGLYGKTWLAYRQKPEEDDHDERKENENV